MLISNPYMDTARSNNPRGKTLSNYNYTNYINNNSKPLKDRSIASTNTTFKGFDVNSQKNDISFKGKVPEPIKNWFTNSLTNEKGLLHRASIVANRNPNLLEAFCAFIVATTLRPLTILALPNTEKGEKSKKEYEEDKKYAAAHSISSGVVGLGVAFALFNPIKDSINRVTDKIKSQQAQGVTEAAQKLLKSKTDAFGKITNQTIKIMSSPLQAALLVALIPPIVKFVLGEKKGKEVRVPADHPVPFAAPLKDNVKQDNIYRKYIQMSGRQVQK